MTRVLSPRRAVLPVTVAALLAVSGCSKSPEDFEPTPVPDADRVTDVAALEGTRWRLGRETMLLGEDDGYFEFCTSPASARVVTSVVLREDGFVDTEKECDSSNPGRPTIDDLLPDPVDIELGDQVGLTWELDDDGWLRFERDNGFLCEADGVSETDFQMLCFGSEDTVIERTYSKVG